MYRNLSILFISITLLIFLSACSSNQEESTTSISTSSITQNNSENNEESQLITMAELESHSSQTDCWTTMKGKVYDITAYVPQHPGGISDIMRACGTDGGSLFESESSHGADAKAILNSFYIGDLAQ